MRTVDDLKIAIDALAHRVHPVLGDRAYCATRDPYVAFAMRASLDTEHTRRDLLARVFADVRVYAEEGRGWVSTRCEDGMLINELPLRFLYWRLGPEFEQCVRAVDGGWVRADTANSDVNALAPRGVLLRCRLAFAGTWAERGQVGADEEAAVRQQEESDRIYRAVRQHPQQLAQPRAKPNWCG